MNNQWILSHLERIGAIRKGHYVFTSLRHGYTYINMRQAAHDARWLEQVAGVMSDELLADGIDLVIGPETLGRTLAGFVAAELGVYGLWCDVLDTADGKRAAFNPKLDFGRLIKSGMRVAIVDDLLTTGGSVRLVSDLVHEHDAVPVVCAVVVRRTPDVNAGDCGVKELRVMVDMPGFETFTPTECAERGPCSRRVPMTLRPGHGHEWIQGQSGYPVAP